MNEAVREAEERRPGTCHHESAHAVFAYYAGAPIRYVTVGEKSEAMSCVGYTRGDPFTTAMAVAVVLAGRYAEELAVTGSEREHVPFEKLQELFSEDVQTGEPPEGFENDELQVLDMLMKSMGRAKMEGVYGLACVFAVQNVKGWWAEIDALAARLKNTGRLEGAEVERVIQSVSEEE
jgi:hypothetical protein